MSFQEQVLNCIDNCQHILISESPDSLEIVITRMESLFVALVNMECEPGAWVQKAIEILEKIICENDEFSEVTENTRGRPKCLINTGTIEFLLTQNFAVTEISRMLGASSRTIFRRMQDSGLSVRQFYTHIDDHGLQTAICAILNRFPNTGYKRMKGFLVAEGTKVTEYRIREAMRVVDSAGVYDRTLSNRAIVRRQYFVQYFNELWHIDTNHKLIRWKMVVRSGIDGKSRLVTYLHASGDNRADTNFKAFCAAVAEYGVPSRTRSDKGGEHILIAQFMIERRGTDRGSHICGRSVHNQRIERFWRDAFYGILSAYYNMFSYLELDGILNIDDPKHIALLHFVFLPRLNESLDIFRNAWNNHPLSSARNYTPTQLMILNIPPPYTDICLNEYDNEVDTMLCNSISELDVFEEETLTNPIVHMDYFTEEEITQLVTISNHRRIDVHGYEHYRDVALNLL